MSVRRILAVGAVFLLACAGWWILGAATALRSETFIGRLGRQVEALWGTPLVQAAPTFAAEVPGTDQSRALTPSATALKVELRTDYRKKGLLWYPTYVCRFEGRYTVTNAEDVAQKVRLRFAFPAAGGTYDGYAADVDGQPLEGAVSTTEGIAELLVVPPRAAREFAVRYTTRGSGEWRYQPDARTGRVRNLAATVATDFRAVDYPEGGLSPTAAERTGGGMTLRWEAADLITSQFLGVTVPEKLNPGPVTSRITFFAPVCLLFFFIVTATINVLCRVDIHPMHYLFVAAGFFAFHLLLAYMAGLIDIHAAFAVSAAVSVGLVTCYLRGALGERFPWKLAAAAQLFYLVLFSYSFFLKGVTGLTVAVGAVLTLAILMRATARTDWNGVFARAASPRAAPPAPRPPPLP